MTDKELERSVRTAFDHATPNVLDSVLENCQGQKGKVITMTNKKKNPWISRAAAIAAALALVIGLGFGYQALRPNTGSDNSPVSPIITSTVLLDVNPSIELTLNADERVTAAAALNDDGAAVLDGMDLTGSDLEVAMNAVIGAMLRKGYLTNQANTVLVSVSSTDDATGKALQAKLNANVNKLLNTESFNGAVISQTVNNNDALKAVADENQISLGKAKLIQRIMAQNTRYTFEELAVLSINELNLLTESGNLKLDDVISSGAASETKYIGGGEAKRIALADAGITEQDMRNLEIGLDLENGIMVYEIEFDTAEYEYEYDINAVTGEIVWKDKEYDPDNRPVTPPTTEPPTSEPSNTEPPPVEPTPPTEPAPTVPPVVTPERIDKDAALNAAYEHAGVKAADATQIECELDRDHGIYIYEIEFRAGDYEYDYDINAETGAVIRYEKELDKKAEKPVTPPETPAYITAEAAKTFALEHAGVTADEIFDYSYELETGHGKARYEIDFETTETEFEYVIDAKTGAVISFEKEANDDRPSAPPVTEPPAEYISKDEAKAAALNHAGVAADAIRDYSCELDKDNGRAIYEIEFESGKYSYEYEIDAVTGAVITSDKEVDD